VVTPTATSEPETATPETATTPGTVAPESDAAARLSASFDLINARMEVGDEAILFAANVEGTAGAEIPQAIGMWDGAQAFAYLWPTTLPAAVAGFGPLEGLLTFAVTSHPDFDDTPLVDESGDEDPKNDGVVWHSHWLELVPNEACRAGWGVRQIEEESPIVPPDWPGLNVYLSSPHVNPTLIGEGLVVSVPHGAGTLTEAFEFDAATAVLEMSLAPGDPLLCIGAFFDVASGALSLPLPAE
jgi:hypothetical protein